MNRELTDPRDIKSKTLPQLQEELAALGLPWPLTAWGTLRPLGACLVPGAVLHWGKRHG